MSTIERFFISLKESGLFLSSQDYHLISQWESRGIPANKVCHAIEKGIREHQKTTRSPFQQKVSLSLLEKYIESEIQEA